MMQNSCRLIVRQLKCFNYSVHNTFLHNYIFKQELLRNVPHRFPTVNLQKFFSTTSPLPPRKKTVSNLEDLKNYIGEQKQFYLKLLVNILENIQFDNVSPNDATLLFTCCGGSVTDSSKQARDSICQQIYKKLVDCNNLNLDICHIYIEVCTENGVILNCKEFLSKLKPDQKTFKLLLANVCEKGDVGQAIELLEIMKDKGISVNEDIFNTLVLAHTIQGGIESGENVLKTMRTAQIPETALTKFSFLKGVFQRDNSEDVDFVLQKYPIDLTEHQLLELVEILGLSGNISWLEKIKHLYIDKNITREFISAIGKICVHLVHMDKSENAFVIYKEFVTPDKDPNYGFFILKEMLHCDVDIEKIIKLCKHLHNSNLNDCALENLTYIALKHKYTEASWKLLENMSVLRPHFFWPLLLDANRKQGETGTFSVLQQMVNMGVQIDSETMQLYVFPFCNLNDTKLIIKKLNNFNVTVKEALSPLLTVLLRNKKIRQATELCNSYNVNIHGVQLFQAICSSWPKSKDRRSVVALLQRYCESNPTETDLVQNFLTETLNSCRNNEDFEEYIKLLELIKKNELRIDPGTAENLQKLSSTACSSPELYEKISNVLDTMIDFGVSSELTHIPHPRDMSLNDLECHLVELKEKNMETRGVFRKLILQHSSLGHLERVNELRTDFLSAGYEESVGMKSSLMHNYIKQGWLDQALSVYNEIKEAHPQFKIDNFKVIDLVTLMVKEERYGEAMDLLKTEDTTKKVGPSSIEKSCWKLLSSYENPEEQLKMFQFLIENDYCKPTNIIFGPLVRMHLKRGDLQKCVKIYLNCAKEYNCTPLQLELIKELVKDENKIYLENVVEATRNVHGVVPTQTVLISALAENGTEKALQKLLMENRVNVTNGLKKRCERWVQEGKVEALHTLARACERLPKDVYDVNFVYNCIMRTYNLLNNQKAALEFYKSLLEKEIIIDKQLEMQFNNLKKSESNI